MNETLVADVLTMNCRVANCVSWTNYITLSRVVGVDSWQKTSLFMSPLHNSCKCVMSTDRYTSKCHVYLSHFHLSECSSVMAVKCTRFVPFSIRLTIVIFLVTKLTVLNIDNSNSSLCFQGDPV